MFTRMFHSVSDRSLPVLESTSRQFAARVHLPQSEKSSTGFPTSVSEIIGLLTLSLSSSATSASRMMVSGLTSSSPVARTKRTVCTLCSHGLVTFKRSRCVKFLSDCLATSHTCRPIDTATNRCTARYAGCWGDKCIVVVTVESARSSTSSEPG
jgi:hypothetical protein